MTQPPPPTPRFSTQIGTETIFGTTTTKMTVATIIGEGVGQRLATVATSKKGGILTTNLYKPLYQYRFRYGESEMTVQMSGGEGVGST